MEIRTGRYTNFILTVIACLLAALVLQASLGLVATASAQSAGDPQVTEEQVQGHALLEIAAAIGEVAEALDDVVQSNHRIASAIEERLQQ